MNIMTMLYLFLSLFASSLLLVTPCVIVKEQIEDSEDPPSFKVNQTISEFSDPKTIEAPWSNVEFPLEEAQHDVDTCRKVSMYVNFTEIGLADKIIAPRGFYTFQCEGNCLTPREKISDRLAIMALLKKKKGISDVACCVPTKLTPISALLFDKNGNIVLRKIDDMVVKECGCM